VLLAAALGLSACASNTEPAAPQVITQKGTPFGDRQKTEMFPLGASSHVAIGNTGESWRIGVDTSETTTLVRQGAFAIVRNPIRYAVFRPPAAAATQASSGWKMSLCAPDGESPAMTTSEESKLSISPALNG
jgi:hypothetical protein